MHKSVKLFWRDEIVPTNRRGRGPRAALRTAPHSKPCPLLCGPGPTGLIDGRRQPRSARLSEALWGVIYEGTHKQTQERVVIRVPSRAPLVASPMRWDAFLALQRALHRLEAERRHALRSGQSGGDPAITGILECGRMADGSPFVVSEFISGGEPVDPATTTLGPAAAQQGAAHRPTALGAARRGPWLQHPSPGATTGQGSWFRRWRRRKGEQLAARSGLL